MCHYYLLGVGFCRQAPCVYAMSQVGSSQGRYTVEKWPEVGKTRQTEQEAAKTRRQLLSCPCSSLLMNWESLLPAESLNCALYLGNLVSWWGQASIGTLLWPLHTQQGSEFCTSFLVKMNFPLLSLQPSTRLICFLPAFLHLVGAALTLLSSVLCQCNCTTNEDKILCRRTVKLVLFSSFLSVMEILFLLEKNTEVFADRASGDQSAGYPKAMEVTCCSLRPNDKRQNTF